MAVSGFLDSLYYSLFGGEEESSSAASPAQPTSVQSTAAAAAAAAAQTSFLLEAEAARQRWSRAGVIMDLDLPPQPVRRHAALCRSHSYLSGRAIRSRSHVYSSPTACSFHAGVHE